MPEPAASSSVSTLLLQAKRQEIEAVRRLAARAELVRAVAELIHALQRERGASSLFLASQGRLYGDVRDAAVAEAGPAEARLRTLADAQLVPDEAAGSRMLSLLAWVLLGLDALAELRARIAALSVSAHEAVAAYSRLIAGPLELIVQVADATAVPGISRRLVALLHLMQGKEAAGQERAVGALLYGSGRCSEAHQQRVLHLIDAQDRSLQVYAEFADASGLAQWERQQLAPGTAALERLRRTLATARPDAPLDATRSDAWFEASSERIGALHALEIDLLQRLREDCDSQIQSAERELQDAEGLLRRLRDNPPPHAHAVERFFDIREQPAEAPSLAALGESASLLEILQTQAARLASMEAELDAVRRTLHERKVIERAKGVLMSRLGMTEEAAFRAMQKTSMDQNRRLLDVAEATLALPEVAFAPPGRQPR